MKNFYFCAHTVGRHTCGATGKGNLCVLLLAVRAYMGRSLLIAGWLLCQCVISLSARPMGSDSTLISSAKFRSRQLIVPSAFIAVGSFGVSNGWCCSAKRQVRAGFNDLRGDSRFRADDYLQYLPVAANVGLGFAGVQGRHAFRERVAATATAYAVMGVLVNAVKFAVDEKRPDSEGYRSFPSGHTATAFCGAELVRLEYGPATGACAYAFATGIAVLRLYNDRHWLNDVVAGAGFGLLSARVGYWLLPWERHVLGWDKSEASVAVLPAYDGETGSFGLGLAVQF